MGYHKNMSLVFFLNVNPIGEVKCTKGHTSPKSQLFILDCHLMVTNPLDYAEPFCKVGASGLVFHAEVIRDN